MLRTCELSRIALFMEEYWIQLTITAEMNCTFSVRSLFQTIKHSENEFNVMLNCNRYCEILFLINSIIILLTLSVIL